MAMPWINRVKQRGTLLVYPDGSLATGNWRSIFNQAITQFNTISRRYQLRVTLEQSSEPPATSAHVPTASVEQSVDQAAT